MKPEPITIDGRTGVVVFLDAEGQPVEPSDERAVVAKAIFDDGGRTIYQVQPKEQHMGRLDAELERRRRVLHLEREYVRDEAGKFAETGGAGGGGEGDTGGGAGGMGEHSAGAMAAAGPASASHTVEVPTKAEELGKTRPEPIKAKDLAHAVELILKGETVELKDVGAVATVLEKLADMAKDAEAKKEKAPNYDLCKVSVAGSNLFCGSAVKTKEFPNGIPRIDMPQLTGKAVPGTDADKLPRDDKGEINAVHAFLQHLEGANIKVTSNNVPAAGLKATQVELVGPTVAGMMTDPTYDPGEEPIFVSSDGYVLDGHHRWAAVVGRDSKDGTLGQSTMNVRVVDAPISELLHRANTWTKKFGMAPKRAGAKTALAMIFDGDIIVLPYREKLAKLLSTWGPQA